jgi:hypothetical protein
MKNHPTEEMRKTVQAIANDTGREMTIFFDQYNENPEWTYCPTSAVNLIGRHRDTRQDIIIGTVKA